LEDNLGSLAQDRSEAVFPNEATKFFLLKRIISIRLRAVTRGPLTGRQAQTSVPKFAAVGSKLRVAQFALDPSEGGIVADT
jgi:hypothetical protein